MSKVIIVIDGGLVQDVLSDDESIQPLIIDLDAEGAADDEIFSQEEIAGFCGESKFSSISGLSGVMDCDPIIPRKEEP